MTSSSLRQRKTEHRESSQGPERKQRTNFSLGD
jgi:hypothetical protein